METLGLLGLIFLGVVGVIVLVVIALAVYLSCTMFRSAGHVELKDDYLPPEIAGAQAKLDGARLNLEVLQDLGGAEFVLPDAANDVEQARADMVDATRRRVRSAQWRVVKSVG